LLRKRRLVAGVALVVQLALLGWGYGWSGGPCVLHRCWPGAGQERGVIELKEVVGTSGFPLPGDPIVPWMTQSVLILDTTGDQMITVVAEGHLMQINRDIVYGW